MKTFSRPTPGTGRVLWALAIFLFLGQGAWTPAGAAGPPTLPTQACRSSSLPSASLSPPAGTLALASGRGSLFASLQTWLGNRKTMLQLATIGMVLGLFIMMRK